MKHIAQALVVVGLCFVGVFALIYGHEVVGGLLILVGIGCLFGEFD